MTRIVIAALLVVAGAGLFVALLVAARRARAAARIEAARAVLVSGAHLELCTGPLAGHCLTVHGGVLTIGSVAGNDLVLPDPAVSRRHCELRRTAAGWEIHDTGAANGVWVNGRRVGFALLAPGDRLRLGEHELRFAAGPGTEAVANLVSP